MDIEITDKYEYYGCFHCAYQEECEKHQDDDDFVPYCADYDDEDI